MSETNANVQKAIERRVNDAVLTLQLSGNEHRMFVKEMTEIMVDAYMTVPFIGLKGASARTALIEQVIEAISNNLIEHPSTPYTEQTTMNLMKSLESLEVSIRIDKEAA